MTDLIQRLAEGPGSRELSDEVLAAIRYDPPGGVRQGMVLPSPTESVDDALALGDGRVMWMEAGKDYALAYFHPDQPCEATGKNPLPRAICIAVLKAK